MDINEYQNSYLYMFKEFMFYRDSLERLIKRHIKELDKFKNKNRIPFDSYWSLSTQYSFHFMKMNNIIADNAKESISYQKLISKNYLKEFSIILEPKSDEMNNFINKYNKARNWSSHFPISSLRAHQNSINIISEKDELLVNTPSHVSYDHFKDLLISNQRDLKNIDLIKEVISKDAQTILGKKIKIKRTSNMIDEPGALKRSYDSYRYSHDRDKRNPKK